MREWSKRSNEIRFLLNPAFCGRIIYASVEEYRKRCGNDMPFPLVYLVLPLILHRYTREKILPGSKTNLIQWTQSNNDILIGFPARTRGLLETTDEAVEFLLCAGLIEITEDGCIKRIQRRRITETEYTDEEIEDCLSKVKYVSRWFADLSSIDIIFSCLGVKP